MALVKTNCCGFIDLDYDCDFVYFQNQNVYYCAEHAEEILREEYDFAEDEIEAILDSQIFGGK